MSDQLTTYLMLLVGSVAGGTHQLLEDIDLISGIALKLVSIISFLIVILINLPKLVALIKSYLNPNE